MIDLDGLLVVDKDQDWTSHDVCAFVRSRFRIKKVGHAGTLDPLATGVLVLLLGKMTKRSQEFSSCDKEYFGSFRLGVRTDSQDLTGQVLEERAWESVTEVQLKKAVEQFTGELQQTPPMVSALKRDGIRLYRLARAGKTVDRPSRSVTVHEFRIEEIKFPEVRFFTRVSKGTYLRTLVNDLGESLGSLAALSELRRVRSGALSIKDAVSIDRLRNTDRSDFPDLVKDPASISELLLAR